MLTKSVYGAVARSEGRAAAQRHLADGGMIAISLGWGVQSFTLAAMSALGELDPVDVAIHADTTHESKLTYEFAARWTPWLEEHGVRVVTVSDPEQSATVTTFKTDIPAFTVGNSDNGGMLRRQCTHRWKINPMRKWLQDNRDGATVEQWLGISLDEFQRMKDSDRKYIKHRWPLIERRMTRLDCMTWLDRHGIEIPPKSACTFCPFHSTAEWRRIKQTPEDWQEAITVDEAIRKVRPPYDLYLHPSRIPLVDVDLRSEADRGQLSLWDAECDGVCGV